MIIMSGLGAVTRLVMIAWSSGEEKLGPIEQTEDTTSIKFTNMVQNYKETGKVVAALQDIFQEWFVMMWVVYFVGVTGNGVLLLRTAYNTSYTDDTWVDIMAFINDITAFLILYLCGGLMNHYHQKYRDTLEEVQESNSDVLSECIQQKADLIPSNPKYKFIPSFCCVSIPLDSGFGFALIFVPFVLSLVPTLTNKVDMEQN